MDWEDGLFPDQLTAASNTGAQTRLLADPGTGKTFGIRRRVGYLIDVMGIDPSNILALTFTRAVAQKLRQRFDDFIEGENRPLVYTLHSFSLRQLLGNSDKLVDLPRIDNVEDLFKQLSVDRQSLDTDSGAFSSDPKLISCWEEHRRIFGYTLRSELVNQLKKSLEQIDDFKLEVPLNLRIKMTVLCRKLTIKKYMSFS